MTTTTKSVPSPKPGRQSSIGGIPHTVAPPEPTLAEAFIKVWSCDPDLAGAADFDDFKAKATAWSARFPKDTASIIRDHAAHAASGDTLNEARTQVLAGLLVAFNVSARELTPMVIRARGDLALVAKALYFADEVRKVYEHKYGTGGPLAD